ncbi:MAG: DUF5058 family protein [Sphaerochaetaceae bacterium]|nr:DUF5058 family protein [Sphaerochaetaceae bacterium]
MSVFDLLNSAPVYVVCGSIIGFVALICIIFIVRAYRAGLAIGMERAKLNRVISSCIAFSVVPSIGILLGVIALSGSLGIPWPWLRLSVIGALHYETQVAEAAAEQLGASLNPSEMTAQVFSTVALLMSLCIVWEIILSALFNKSYLKKFKTGNSVSLEKKSKSGFADTAMASMFIGLISAYTGSYVGQFVSSGGLFSFKGDWIPLIVVTVSALTMCLFTWLEKSKKQAWLEGFSVAISMFAGMTAAVIIGLFR